METLKFKVLYALMLFLPLLINSCEEEVVITDNIPEQMFRPVELLSRTEGVIVAFTWTPIKDATYSLQISKDSLLFTNDLQTYATDSMKYTAKNLLPLTRYSARVKAVSSDPLIKDSGWQEITFMTELENIFTTISTADIGVNDIMLSWIKGSSVTTIVASATGVPDVVVTLSASDLIAGKKLITDLSAGTTYIFNIYNGITLRGTVTLTTMS